MTVFYIYNREKKNEHACVHTTHRYMFIIYNIYYAYMYRTEQ